LTLLGRAGYTPKWPQSAVPAPTDQPQPVSEDLSLCGDRTQYLRRAVRRHLRSGPIRPGARPAGL